MSIVFSGVQPSGSLHIGNYIGAINNFVELQEQGNECYFCVVDLHACTSATNFKEVRDKTVDIIKWYIACGLKVDNIFVQSKVKQHLELSWLLHSFARIGWLNRMTQFKEKQGVTASLYCYPILMAADILLYYSDIVPVGDDQMQHLELAADIAKAANNFADRAVFKIPKPHITSSARIMSLSNPDNKMSKSDNDIKGTIYLSDSQHDIEKKIKSAVSGIQLSPEYPGVANLVKIYSSILGINQEKVYGRFDRISDFKSALVELLVKVLSKIQDNANKISNSEIDNALDNTRALEVARKNIREIKCGLNLTI